MTPEEQMKNVDMTQYEKNYSEEGLWDKVTSKVQAAGIGLIYKALQLYYAAQNPACPTKVKAGIYAALGYFILPLDIIPDFTPVIGYSDDLFAMGSALMMAQMYIDESVKQQSKDRIQALFGDAMVKKLEEVLKRN